MTEKHRFTDSILKSMKTLLKGEVKFVERQTNWSSDITVRWNKRFVKVLLKSRKTDLRKPFVSCTLKQAHFLSFLFRSDAFNFYGNKSNFSELILQSAAAQNLMDCKNALIKLNGECLIFEGGVRKKDIASLSNVFILNEMLMEEIDELIVEQRKLH